MSYKNEKTLTLAEQFASLKALFPQFSTTLHASFLTVKGEIQPTARSEKYQFRLKYYLHQPPDIIIVHPKLTPNFKDEKVPHVYPGMKLCLYKPGYREFTKGKYLSQTVIGWISAWLYYYEIWHIIGEWLGGGEHPKPKIAKSA